jgi:predicted transcriptional regulator
MILQKIIDEIKEIPESRQEELYQMIQAFRHHLNDEPVAEPYDTPNEEIIEGIREGMRQALAGEVIPLKEMWEGIDVD